MTTPRQPTPPTPEHVAKYVASQPDFTCPGCGDTFRQGTNNAAEVEAWTRECEVAS